jgi:hypothetical protein
VPSLSPLASLAQPLSSHIVGYSVQCPLHHQPLALHCPLYLTIIDSLMLQLLNRAIPILSTPSNEFLLYPRSLVRSSIACPVPVPSYHFLVDRNGSSVHSNSIFIQVPACSCYHLAYPFLYSSDAILCHISTIVARCLGAAQPLMIAPLHY